MHVGDFLARDAALFLHSPQRQDCTIERLPPLGGGIESDLSNLRSVMWWGTGTPQLRTRDLLWVLVSSAMWHDLTRLGHWKVPQ